MNKLKELIEWMEEEKKVYEESKSDTFKSVGVAMMVLSDCINKVKELQEEEPRMYTQEEMDKSCKDAYERAVKFYGEPFIPDPSKQRIA